MRSSTPFAFVAFVSLWGCVACGPQYADPIIGSESTPSEDACSKWVSLEDCAADSEHGCSFQPNQVGCLSSDTTCQGGQCRGGDPYVSRVSQTLWLHGAPYRFIGAVSWGIAGWGEASCRYWTHESYGEVLNQTFDELATARVNVLKFWAFQSFAGNTGLDFTRFDQMIAAARRAGIRLIPVLENHWADCTSGGEKNDAWFSSGYKLPYGNYALSYREYVRAILRRYRDEPTLLAWELFHEAHGTDSAALQAFFEDMTQVVRMDAPNHLIIAGLDNGDSPATRIDGSPSSFKQLNSLSTVDLIDLHDFEQPSTPLPNHFTNLLLLATELKKPVFIGAAAVTLEASTESAFVKRANVLASKIEATQDAGSVGFLIYDYNPNWTELRWSFDGREGEPLAGENGVLARFSPGNP